MIVSERMCIELAEIELKLASVALGKDKITHMVAYWSLMARAGKIRKAKEVSTDVKE
jgi:hypothetical protein